MNSAGQRFRQAPGWKEGEVLAVSMPGASGPIRTNCLESMGQRASGKQDIGPCRRRLCAGVFLDQNSMLWMCVVAFVCTSVVCCGRPCWHQHG